MEGNAEGLRPSARPLPQVCPRRIIPTTGGTGEAKLARGAWTRSSLNWGGPFAFLGVQGIIAPMKVVLVRDVPRVGKAGDVKEVADGYARNFLLRRNLALPATPAAMKDVESRLRKQDQEEQRHVDELNKVAEQLEGLILTFSIKAKAVEGERLYGSIRDNQIAEELVRLTGAAIDRAMVILEAPIRTLGTHELTVRLSKDLTPKVKVVVAREE
jgi:large subunit ribosomal protein L9